MKLLEYQTLQSTLVAEYCLADKRFNAKKKLPAVILNSIVYHTRFLDYDASTNNRVSYIVNDILTQKRCIECNAPIRTQASILLSSDFCTVSCSKKNLRTKDRRKNTNVDRHGYENFFCNSADVKEAVHRKYGVDNVSKLPHVQEVISRKNVENASTRLGKTRSTCLARYGVETVSQLPRVQEAISQKNTANAATRIAKFRDTCIDRYGVDNPSKDAHVIEKIKQTKTERYANHSFNNRNKAVSTMQARYGGHSQRAHWPLGTEESLNDYEFMLAAYDSRSIIDIAAELECSSHVVRLKLKEHGLYDQRESQPERFIESILVSADAQYEKNNRTVLNGLELDFYIPEAKLAIEVNGLYWHSELAGKNRSYHLNKSKLCSEAGVRLVHIWEYQIASNPSLIKSFVLHLLNASPNRVYARKTQVTELSRDGYNQFMEENHIQGTVNAGVRYGLIHNGCLVAAMSFGKSRFKKGEYELLRFASIKDYSVVGGASKLFAHFLKQTDVTTVISYANRDISVGDVYEQLGFTYVAVTPPGYMYFKGIEVFNRMHFQKHKLGSILTEFNPALSEWENMKNNGYNRIWTTGNIKYEYRTGLAA